MSDGLNRSQYFDFLSRSLSPSVSVVSVVRLGGRVKMGTPDLTGKVV